MSECVVRMEFRKNCLDCDLHQIVYGDSYADTDVYCFKEKRLVGKRFGPVKDLARPDWCPIICQLPEGHGRLIDADELLEHLEACLQNGRPLSNLYDLSEIVRYVKSMPTISASPWHRVEEPPKEEGRYIVAVFFSGHWIFDAAWFTHDITEIYCVPCEKKISGFYRGNHEVHPDYWMPIEPPKEDA